MVSSAQDNKKCHWLCIIYKLLITTQIINAYINSTMKASLEDRDITSPPNLLINSHLQSCLRVFVSSSSSICCLCPAATAAAADAVTDCVELLVL